MVASTAVFFEGMIPDLLFLNGLDKVCVDVVALILRIALHDPNFKTTPEHGITDYWLLSENADLIGSERGQWNDAEIFLIDYEYGYINKLPYSHILIMLGHNECLSAQSHNLIAIIKITSLIPGGGNPGYIEGN